MEDSLHLDIHVQAPARSARRARAVLRPARQPGAGVGEQPELLVSEPINLYHWAAVALVTSLMCAVLAFAAGTPALSRAASVTSAVFGMVGGALVLAGVICALRFRFSRDPARECAS